MIPIVLCFLDWAGEMGRRILFSLYFINLKKKTSLGLILRKPTTTWAPRVFDIGCPTPALRVSTFAGHWSSTDNLMLLLDVL